MCHILRLILIAIYSYQLFHLSDVMCKPHRSQAKLIAFCLCHCCRIPKDQPR